MKYFLTTSAIWLTSTLAFASDTQDAAPPNKLEDLAVSFLPIGLFFVVLYFIFRKQRNSKLVQLSERNIERNLEHMERMEELMERLVKAVEQKKE
jgi:hypothetical protein